MSPPKECQKFAHFKPQRAPDSVTNILSKQDTLVASQMTKTPYGKIGHLEFFYHKLCSITRCRMKKTVQFC